jgi:hypothetical protein
MPFSFKPTEEPQGVQAPVTPMGAPTYGGAVTPPLMSRDDGTKSSLLHTLLLGIFDILVVVAVLLFGYKYYLSSQIDAKKAQLATYETQLGSLPFNDIRKVSNRLKLITQLIQTHPSVNVALRILEESVENSVTYTRFDLHYADANKGYELGLGALASNYHAVIQQMDTLRSKPFSNYISNPVINNLHPDQTGLIGFSVVMPIIVTGVLPETLVLNTVSITPEATPTQTTITATTTINNLNTSLLPPVIIATSTASTTPKAIGTPGTKTVITPKK